VRIAPSIAALALAVSMALPAHAEVRFGRNVRIGGHDVSGQTFTPQRRGLFLLHRRTPKNEGCRWARTREGRIKICRWKTRPH
jgi:hypothetical protein